MNRVLVFGLTMVTVVALNVFLSMPASAGLFRKNPVDLEGQSNPEFNGKSFSGFAVSAVNVPPEFRKQYEQRMHDYLRKVVGKKAVVLQFRDIAKNYFFETSSKPDATTIIEDLKNQGVEALIFFNISTDGGENLTSINSLEEAILASAFHNHDPGPVRYYGHSEVRVYELESGKIVWRGSGIIKAKTNTEKWFKISAKTQAKLLYKYLRKAGLLQKD